MSDGRTRGLVDLHLHSTFSPDARVTAEQHCRTALSLGIRRIGFSEHLEFDPSDQDFGYFNYPAYLAEIRRCRELFSGRLEITAGVEVTWLPDLEREIGETLASMTHLDHVIGSVHMVGRGNMTDPREVGDFFQRRTASEVYRPYFELLGQAAASGLFDILGHFDVAKKFGVTEYGPFVYSEWAHLVDPVLEQAATAGLVLEINASGLRQYPNETYPTADLLDRFRQLGGAGVTLGSDGHVRRHGCWGLDQAAMVARAAGFSELAVFVGRKRTFVELPSPC
jgi:histidinol-phosphatase (PHP family)